jgi:hypothetical protein
MLYNIKQLSRIYFLHKQTVINFARNLFSQINIILFVVLKNYYLCPRKSKNYCQSQDKNYEVVFLT